MERLSIFIIVFLIISCGNKEEQAKNISKEIPLFPDPVHTSMSGKSRVLVCETPSVLCDTLFFDSKGRLVKTVDKYSYLKIAYDSNNFVTRILNINDYPSNQVISYDIKGD